MPPVKNRSWKDGLDNFGDNLTRLGAALRAISEYRVETPERAQLLKTIHEIGSQFTLAFQQVQPVLSKNDPDFAGLVRSSVPITRAELVGGNPGMYGAAASLLEEAFLTTHEVVELLDALVRDTEADFQTAWSWLRPLLLRLADDTTSLGWRFRSICHEFEVRNAALAAGSTGAANPGSLSIGIISDMASAVGRARALRLDWFRFREELDRATGYPRGPAQREFAQ